jgi:RNA polymerase sigma factor (sigma-70 family)
MVDHFYEKYKEKMNEPIVVGFLQVEENKQLLDNYLLAPTQRNKERVDEAFTIHFRKVKMYSYISKLIKFYTIDFDKRMNKRKKRFLYFSEGTEDSTQTNLEDSTFNEFSQLPLKLEEHIENKAVYTAFKRLPNIQTIILNLIYVHQLSNKEIAQLLDESEQKISYNHRSALNKLKKYIERGGSVCMG